MKRTPNKESARKVDSGKENSPAAPAGIRTCNLSNSYQQAITTCTEITYQAETILTQISRVCSWCVVGGTFNAGEDTGSFVSVTTGGILGLMAGLWSSWGKNCLGRDWRGRGEGLYPFLALFVILLCDGLRFVVCFLSDWPGNVVCPYQQFRRVNVNQGNSLFSWFLKGLPRGAPQTVEQRFSHSRVFHTHTTRYLILLRSSPL